MEHDANPHIYAAIQNWLNGSRQLEKPPILSFLGALTIADVRDAPTSAERARVTRAWMDSVWEAYESQHDLAHARIQQALGH